MVSIKALYRLTQLEHFLHLKEKKHFSILSNTLLKCCDNDDKYIAIVIDHFFIQDISALQHATQKRSDFDIKVIDPYVFVNLIKCYLPLTAGILDGYYNPILNKNRYKLRKRLMKIAEKLSLTGSKVCFVSPSDSFWWIREFIHACKQYHIPFVVLDKEGTIAPYFFTKHAMELKKFLPCICDFVLVWSKRQKEFYIARDFDKTKIQVVGQPRSDFWFSKERWRSKADLFNEFSIPANKPCILYFDFERNNYIHDDFYLKGFTWDILLKDIHCALFDIAKRNPGISIIFKLHPQALNYQNIIDLINNKKLINVFAITGAEVSNNLIVNSDLIIGQVTTALIDAMITDKPIIYPFWSNASEFSQYLIPFHENRGIDVVTNVDYFKEIIQNYIDNNFNFTLTDEKQASRKFLVESFYEQCDGHSSERAIEALIQIIDKNSVSA